MPGVFRRRSLPRYRPTRTHRPIVGTARALVVGVISLVAKTNTTISLSATDATGGTQVYTYQWYRSTSSGFTPGGGNILTGKTALTLADTGLLANTTYYYILRYTDGNLTTADTNEFGVTTDYSGGSGGGSSVFVSSIIAGGGMGVL